MNTQPSQPASSSNPGLLKRWFGWCWCCRILVAALEERIAALEEAIVALEQYIARRSPAPSSSSPLAGENLVGSDDEIDS